MALREQDPRPAVRDAQGRPAQFRPVLGWAAVGALLLAFELFVLVRWVAGASFRPTDPGLDAIDPGTGRADPQTLTSNP